MVNYIRKYEMTTFHYVHYRSVFLGKQDVFLLVLETTFQSTNQILELGLEQHFYQEIT